MTGEIKQQQRQWRLIDLLLIVVMLDTAFIAAWHYAGGRYSPSISDLGWFDPFSSWAWGCGVPIAALSWPGLYTLALWGAALRYRKAHVLFLAASLIIYIGAIGLAKNSGNLGSLYGYSQWKNVPVLLVLGVAMQWTAILGTQLLGIVESARSRSRIGVALYLICLFIWAGQTLESLDRP